MDNYYHLLIACLFYIMLTYYFDHILESVRYFILFRIVVNQIHYYFV